MKYIVMTYYKYIFSCSALIMTAVAGFSQTHQAKKMVNTVKSSPGKPATGTIVPAALTSGKWGIYAGIQKVYIGHFILLSNGKYRVALSSDETKYAEGLYRFNNTANSIEWQSGLFRHNAWDGKLVLQKDHTYQLQFTSQTFGTILQQ